jgi:hypothetical protein
MPSHIEIYKVKDFVRLNESGEIDFDRSMKIVRKLGAASSVYADHNVLLDLRETTIVGVNNMGTIMQLALEMANYWSAFKGRIANVLPNDEARLSIARQFRASLQLQGFSYEIFTNFEEAISWLSEVTALADSDE